MLQTAKFRFHNRKVGADPEVFLATPEGKAVSAIGLIGGTKAKPRPVEKLGEGFFKQEDNVAAEFNIPPCSTSRQFDQAIAKMLLHLTQVAKSHKKKLLFSSAEHFTPIELLHPDAMNLGCDPDFDAWNELKRNPRPTPPATLRTAAGHVHIGWDNPLDHEKLYLIQFLDLLLGVPSILATTKNERRSLYGKAGACRLKKYGVEYRTLDNFWIQDRENRQFVFDACDFATSNLTRNPAVLEDLHEHKDMIVACINDHDKDKALQLSEVFGLSQFPKAYL
jgi:hypothetical protein